MIIKQNFLPIGPSRPGTPLDRVLAIVLHWPADPGASALAIRNYWASSGNTAGASAHCAIDADGTIVQVMPWNERAYHVGSAQADPASGRVYTDQARELFGVFAANPKTTSPNHCTIGIEMCHTDMTGAYSDETVGAAVELCAQLCGRYGLEPSTQIIRHVDVVGWKQCPRWYIEHEDDFAAFKDRVSQAIQAGR